MTSKNNSLRFLAILSVLGTTLSCQENSVDELSQLNPEQLAAEKLVEKYFASEEVRAGFNARGEDINEWSSRYTLTMFRLDDDEIEYSTNSDDVDGWEEVEEYTVTGYVEPGDLLFWYASKGMALMRTNGIDFDAEALKVLREAPKEFEKDRFWVVRVPLDADSNELKYDIVYRSEDSDESVRLDPKIRVQ